MTNSVFVATSFTVDLIEDIEDDIWDCEGFATPLMAVGLDLNTAVERIVAKEMDEIVDMHDPDDGNAPAPHELTTRLVTSSLGVNELLRQRGIVGVTDKTTQTQSWVYRMELRGKFYGTIVVRLYNLD